MALPNVPYAATTNPQMVFLDQTFSATAALGVIPCTAGGTENAIVLTPNSNTPSLSAYANYQQFSFVASGTPTGDVTIQVAGLGTIKTYRPGQPTSQASSGDWPAAALLVVAYDSALDSGSGGFAIVSSVQPAIVPATAAQARAATNGSTAMTPANLIFSPYSVAASATVISGGVVLAGHNMRAAKQALGLWFIAFTSTQPTTTTYQPQVTNGDGNLTAFVRAESTLLSGFTVRARNAADSLGLDIQPFHVSVVGGNF